jgi:hypothetical protein
MTFKNRGSEEIGTCWLWQAMHSYVLKGLLMNVNEVHAPQRQIRRYSWIQEWMSVSGAAKSKRHSLLVL